MICDFKPKAYCCFCARDAQTCWYTMCHNWTVQRWRKQHVLRGRVINAPVIRFHVTNEMIGKKECCDRTHRKQFVLHNCISWRSVPASAIPCHSAVMKPALKCRAPNTDPGAWSWGAICVSLYGRRSTDHQKHNNPYLFIFFYWSSHSDLQLKIQLLSG